MHGERRRCCSRAGGRSQGGAPAVAAAGLVAAAPVGGGPGVRVVVDGDALAAEAVSTQTLKVTRSRGHAVTRSFGVLIFD